MEEGAIAGVAKVHRELAAKVSRFIEDFEVVIDWEKFDTFIVRNLKKRIIDLSDRALGRGAATIEAATAHG